jgi:hypothetical protein
MKLNSKNLRKLQKKHRTLLITTGILVLALLLALFVLAFSHRGTISDESRESDLLAIEKAIGRSLKQQNIDQDDKKIVKDLRELQSIGLQGDINDYKYTEPEVYHFGYTYTICTNFDREVKKFSSEGYPNLSDDQEIKLYEDLSKPYSPHRVGNNCFKINANNVKGIQRTLIGSADIYKP